MPKKKHPCITICITLIIMGIIIWQQTADIEPLQQVQQQLAEVVPNTDIPTEQNGFIAMVGFSADSSQSMIVQGHNALKESDKKAKEDPFIFLIPFNTPSALKMAQAYQLPCNTNDLKTTCIKNIIDQQDTIKKYVDDNQGLINNYLALQKFTRFAHIAPPQTNSTPPYIYINNISELLEAKAIIDIKEGDTSKGMQFLLNDFRFYRQLLSNEKINLQETYLAINALSRLTLIMKELINEGINIQTYISELLPLITPLSDQERDVTWTLNNEMKAQLITLTSLGREYFYTGDSPITGCHKNSCSFSRFFSLFLYKFHGTLNAVYLDWQPIISFAEKNRPFDNNFIEQLKAIKNIENTHHSMAAARLYDRYGLFLLKNYSGELTKNKAYFIEGYTDIFVRLFTLNEELKELRQTINDHTQKSSSNSDEKAL